MLCLFPISLKVISLRVLELFVSPDGAGILEYQGAGREWSALRQQEEGVMLLALLRK